MEKMVKLFANGLILLGFCVLGYIYYPLLEIYLFPEPFKTTFSSQDYVLTIPKIHAQAKIIADVDPWNESNYLPALKQGVAEAKNFASPGEKGTLFLFAHSSGNPWELTRNNTIFLRLPELNFGDKIFINHGEHEYAYTVSYKIEVWPNQVNLVNSQNEDQLILQTCTPIGTSLKRFLVFAKPD